MRLPAMRLTAITACYTVIATHADRNEKWNVGKADRRDDEGRVRLRGACDGPPKLLQRQTREGTQAQGEAGGQDGPQARAARHLRSGRTGGAGGGARRLGADRGARPQRAGGHAPGVTGEEAAVKRR